MDRLIVDIGSSGAATVSHLVEGQLPQPVGSVELRWPLTDEDGESLRWYVEDFLRAPFGVYEDRGPRIEGSLRGWGELVFGAVFGAGAIRDAFIGARAIAMSSRRGLEVVLQSSAAGWLGLPWELMWQPGDSGPLVLDGVSVARALPLSGLGEAFHPDVADDRLHVLMVISRPEGESDVGFQMVARPLLQRLEAVRGHVELTVLRPPTLDALLQTVQAAASKGRPFQVVHFDGHGVMPSRDYSAPSGSPASRVGSPPVMFAGAPGVLVFEKPEGGADHVSADVVGRVLAAGRVPLVVLNACQSGALGKELEAAVATRLMQGGAASVVAMAYSVYAVAAAEFMAAFYERLFAGGTVTDAVAAGRAQLSRRPLRPSPKGELPLSDWLVPVYYTRREVSFPTLQTMRTSNLPSLEALLDDIRDRTDTQSGDALAAVGEFVGRDGLFYTLEVALRLQRVVVLQGPGGTGKTELAKAFGRWWRDTGGVDYPRLVVFHSFEPGVSTLGLNGVITAIGLQVFGTDFARLDDQQRRQVVAQLLAQHRLLLIWDNFETAHSMPDPNIAIPPLDDTGKQELAKFVQQLSSGGRSALIITSKTREDWLGGTLRRVEVSGLAGEEITTYTEQILAPYPATRAKRQTKMFGELLQWLDGHPLSMRLILPHLERHSAQELLQALQGLKPLPQGDDGGRLTSLPASITYSFTHLPADVSDPLVAVSLFQQVTAADVLALMSTQDGCPARFRGPAAETFDQAKQRWAGILDTAGAVGLLTEIGASIYRIHPALPAYLTAEWKDSAADYLAERNAAEHAVLVALAVLMRLVSDQIGGVYAGFALTVIDLHQANLTGALNRSLQGDEYGLAQELLQSMDTFWITRGLTAEAAVWTDRVRDKVENADGKPPAFDTDAGALWLFMVGAQASRQHRAGLLEQAQRTHNDILNALQSQPDTPQNRRHIAAASHLLGMVAHDRGRLEEAEYWYRKSLTIKEELDRPGMASTYHQLGIVARDRGRPQDAEDWCRKSLTINEELGNRPGMASTYHLLGVVAQDRGRLEEAEDRYRKSLTIKEDLGDRPGMASTYHQLGRVAQDRGRWEEAEDWYRESLTISEELGNRPGMASTYAELGVVAQDRGRLQEAEDWYRKSLTIEEELGDRRGMAITFHQLGRLAQDRGRLQEAEDWYRKSLTIEEELDNRPGLAMSYYQLGRVAQDRGRWEEAEDWYRKSLTIEVELDNRPGMAMRFGQLGLLAEAREQFDEAFEWMVRCVALFPEFPSPSTGPAPEHLRRLTAIHGLRALQRAWTAVTNQALPANIQAWVEV